MRSPFSRMSPEFGLSIPASIRKSVVLPLPDGPTMVKNSPSRISRSIESTAATSPKRLVRDRNSRMEGRSDAIAPLLLASGRPTSSATGAFALRGAHDVEQLVVVGHDV